MMFIFETEDDVAFHTVQAIQLKIILDSNVVTLDLDQGFDGYGRSLFAAQTEISVGYWNKITFYDDHAIIRSNNFEFIYYNTWTHARRSLEQISTIPPRQIQTLTLFFKEGFAHSLQIDSMKQILDIDYKLREKISYQLCKQLLLPKQVTRCSEFVDISIKTK
jgi:hypothetical protein